MKKISSKIILAITLCVVLVASLLGSISILKSGEQIKVEAEANLLNLVSSEAKEVELSLLKTKRLVDTLVQITHDSIDLNRVAKKPVEMDAYEIEIFDSIKSIVEASKSRGYIYFNSNEIQGGNTLSFSPDKNGDLVRAGEFDANTLPREGNAWWYVPLENKDIWTKPYKWLNNATKVEENLISYVKPVEKDGKVIAAAGTDFVVDKFKDDFAKIKIYDSGYMVLLDKDMDTIYHPNEEITNFKTYNDGELLELANKIENGSNQVDIVHYNLGGKDKVAAYYRLSNGWTALACPYLDEMYAGQKYLMWLLVVITVAGILISVIIAYFLGKSISKPIVGFMKDVEVVATGDLSVDVQITTKDEIGLLQKSFISMIDNMKMQADAARKMASGEKAEVEVRSDADTLALGLQGILENNSKLLIEIDNLANSAASGDLTARADEDAFEGNWKELVNKLNGLVEKVEKPVTIAGNYIASMSEGEALDILDASQFEGDYKILIENLNKVRAALYSMIEEGGKLAEEVTKGNLAHKADFSKLKGNYLKIVSGFVQALEDTIKPVEEASIVLADIADGKLDSRVMGDYKGDHAKIKESLNFMAGNIKSYIEEISKVLGEMSDKNLQVGISRDYIGDFSQLKDSINYILEQFNTVLGEINAAAEQVEAGANQVASSSQTLAEGASEQASSLEQVSASITEVAEQTKDNAENANKAYGFARGGSEDAKVGNLKMKDMLSAMDDIKDASKNIGGVIKVIDDIAFQTNILALNAAVEAARAGEHGKGFAVVAEEVRNLAARSAKAAKETTDLIDNSINMVDEGYKLANDTAEMLNGIAEGSMGSVNVNNEIAEASKQQSNAISEINRGIEQISQVTQTNTATTEESASASEEMAGQAQMLKRMIQEFKLKNTSTIKSIPQNLNAPKSLDDGSDLDLPIDLDEDFGKY